MNITYFKNILKNLKYPLFFVFIIIPVGYLMYGLSVIFTQPHLVGTTIFLDKFKIFFEAMKRSGLIINSNSALLVLISLTLVLTRYSLSTTLISVICYYVMLSIFNYLIPIVMIKDIYKEFIDTPMISPFYICGGIILSVGISKFSQNFDVNKIINSNKEIKNFYVSIIKSLFSGIMISFLLAFTWILLINSIVYITSEISHNTFIERFVIGFLDIVCNPLGINKTYDLLMRYTFLGGSFKIPNNLTLIYGYENIWLAQLALSQKNFFVGDSMSFQYIKNLFLFPSIGYALIHTSFAENKNLVRFFIGTFIFICLMTGFSLPIEMILLFTCPILFLLTALLNAFICLSISILSLYFPIHMITLIGGGIIDFIFIGIVPGVWKTGAWLILLFGLVLSPIVYYLFIYIIKKFDLKCFGRRINEFYTFRNKNKNVVLKIDYKNGNVKNIIRALGGKKNIVSLEQNRYSIDFILKDTNKIDKTELKKNGIAGLFISNSTTINLIMGSRTYEYYQQFIKYLV